jgi:uncharacterized protein (TIGR02300 family)
MSTKAERGMKRTCRNNECGSRFYDLNRDPITCPICGAVYEASAAPMAMAAAAPAVADRVRKAPKKPVYPVETVKPEGVPEPEGEEALAAVEGEEETAAAGDEDETFLEEEEEDGADMTNIIGGTVAEPDEPQ